MQTLIDSLEQQARQLLPLTFPELEADLFVDENCCAQISNATFGHYQCHAAMRLAKLLKTPPRQIAEQLATVWRAQHTPMIERLEVAGPGFINIFLAPTYLAQELIEMGQTPYLGITRQKPPAAKVIVDMSSPNIAKELHVGHLRSTIIGDSIARILTYLGYEVLKINHLGDWGTQFGMLIAYLFEQNQSTPDHLAGSTLSDLMGWYRSAKICFDQDPLFQERAKEQVVALQRGDEKVMALWETVCALSRAGFHKVYSLLGVEITERGESWYRDRLEGVLTDCKQSGLLQESEGAQCLFMDGFYSADGNPLPLIVQKADGGYNYATTDLAALKQRTQEECATRLIYVVDAGQALHLEMIFKAAQLVGYLDCDRVEATHVKFGVVLGSDGKKFKTRSGEVKRLLDLLIEAKNRAYQILKERLDGGGSTPPSEQELDQAAIVLGIGAVKYADLSCHRLKDYRFSYERMLRFEGNTVSYLLYSYVRAQSIKRKVGKDLQSLFNNEKIELIDRHELQLGLKIRQFEEVLVVVSRDLLPHRLTDYLYALAEQFHSFFQTCQVKGGPRESSRLMLTEMTGRVIHQGLQLLGIDTLDRM